MGFKWRLWRGVREGVFCLGKYVHYTKMSGYDREEIVRIVSERKIYELLTDLRVGVDISWGERWVYGD